MLVYRVETLEGEGPYMGKDIPHDWNYNRHPCPITDSVWTADARDYTQSFAFSSRKQMQNWFELPARERAHSLGHVLALYEVEKEFVSFGAKQLAFRKDKARLVEVQPLEPGLEKVLTA